MERTYLQFSVINTITVVLMAVFGWVVLSVIATGLRSYAPGGGDGA